MHADADRNPRLGIAMVTGGLDDLASGVNRYPGVMLTGKAGGKKGGDGITNQLFD